MIKWLRNILSRKFGKAALEKSIISVRGKSKKTGAAVNVDLDISCLTDEQQTPNSAKVEEIAWPEVRIHRLRHLVRSRLRESQVNLVSGRVKFQEIVRFPPTVRKKAAAKETLRGRLLDDVLQFIEDVKAGTTWQTTPAHLGALLPYKSNLIQDIEEGLLPLQTMTSAQRARWEAATKAATTDEHCKVISKDGPKVLKARLEKINALITDEETGEFDGLIDDAVYKQLPEPPNKEDFKRTRTESRDNRLSVLKGRRDEIESAIALCMVREQKDYKDIPEYQKGQPRYTAAKQLGLRVADTLEDYGIELARGQLSVFTSTLNACFDIARLMLLHEATATNIPGDAAHIADWVIEYRKGRKD